MAEKHSVDRRDFLKSAAVTGAAAFDFRQARSPVPGATPAPSAQATAPTPPRETDPPATVEVLTTDRPGGDFMVDVIKSLDLEYVAANPGSSFRGIHESIVNYGGNTAPEFITCLHEPRPRLPALTEACKRLITGDRRTAFTAKVVSDADVANIYAFVQSRPAPAKEIPLLRP